MTISLEDVIAAALEEKQRLQDDPTLVPHLYVDRKWTISRIAEHVGLHRSTVYRRLIVAGVYEGPADPGAPRKDKCQRDHDMSVWGVEIPKEKGGGRYCRMCKRLRERKGGIK